jgi:lipid-A-disaccharide synthase
MSSLPIVTNNGNKEADILIVAGEASSSLYAQRILEHYRDHKIKIKAFGIGSDAMEKLGFERLGKSEELAVVGVYEVLKHYPQIREVFYKLIEECEKRKPKVILLLDYPDFNLRLAEKLKPLGIPIVYYISPQVWAWRKSRIHKIKRLVNKMLVLLPFEVDFYRSHGVEVEFVGHPLLDEITPELDSKVDRDRDRSRYGIMPDQQWVGLMPGSRKSELRHLLELQIKCAEKLSEQNKNLKFALLVAPSLTPEKIREFMPSTDLPITYIQDEPFRMIRMMDTILAASGTATLMVGLMGVPMVIIYRMNYFTALVAKLIVKGTAYFGLINLVLNERAVPELFQEAANVENITNEMNKFIQYPDNALKMKSKLLKARNLLGDKGATKKVVSALDHYLRPQ